MSHLSTGWFMSLFQVMPDSTYHRVRTLKFVEFFFAITWECFFRFKEQLWWTDIQQ